MLNGGFPHFKPAQMDCCWVLCVALKTHYPEILRHRHSHAPLSCKIQNGMDRNRTWIAIQALWSRVTCYLHTGVSASGHWHSCLYQIPTQISTVGPDKLAASQ